MPFFLSREQCHIAGMANANQTKDETTQGYAPLGIIVALFAASIASSIVPQLRPDTSTIALLMTTAILGLALCLRVLVSSKDARERRIYIGGLKPPERHRSVALCALLAWGLASESLALKGIVGWLSLLPLVYLFDMMFKMRHSTHYTLGLKPLLLTGFVYVCWPGANPSAVGLILTVLICSGLGHQRAGTAAYRIMQRLPMHAVVLAGVCLLLMYTDTNQARGFLLEWHWHQSATSLLVLTFAIAVLQPSHHILTTVAAAIVFAAIDHFLKLTAANSIFPVGLFPASYLLIWGISWPGSSDSRSSPAYALKIGTLYAINCLILLSILTETSDFFDGQNHTPFAPYLAAGLTALLTLFIEQKHDSAAFGLSRYSVALSCVAGIIWSTHHNFSARVDVALLQASMSCTKTRTHVTALWACL